MIPGIDFAMGDGDFSVAPSSTSGDITQGDSRLSVDGGRITGAALTFNQGSSGLTSAPALIGLGMLVLGFFYLRGR